MSTGRLTLVYYLKRSRKVRRVLLRVVKNCELEILEICPQKSQKIFCVFVVLFRKANPAVVAADVCGGES